MEKPKERDPILDIIRIVATFFVLSVHFFLHVGYYNQIMQGTQMYVMTIFRTTFMVCVPMFLVLTGYLMNKKELSIKYYKGIIKIIGMYILASILCFLYKGMLKNEGFSMSHLIGGILNFTAANYSWYIELYIGLFMIIPFLNLMYHGLKNKKQKQVLIFSFITLTALPLVINIWNFTSLKFWDTSEKITIVFPDYWVSLWPITYYFIGAYLSEYKIKMKTITNILLIIIVAIAFGTFNYWRSYNKYFVQGDYQKSEALTTLIMTVLIFNLFLNLKINKIGEKTKRLLSGTSALCLGIYLTSFVSDDLIYQMLINKVPEYTERFKFFPITVISSFIAAFSMTWVLNLINIWLEKLVLKLGDAISAKIKKKNMVTIDSGKE